MTHTKQFMRDAIGGGWKPPEVYNGWNKTAPIVYWPALYDPLAWQAVGKMRGWHLPIAVEVHFRDHDDYTSDIDFDSEYPEWLWKQHRFIDHLADGDTIEEALGKIE